MVIKDRNSIEKNYNKEYDEVKNEKLCVIFSIKNKFSTIKHLHHIEENYIDFSCLYRWLSHYVDYGW